MGTSINVWVTTCGLLLCTNPLEGAKIYIAGDLKGITNSTGHTYIKNIPRGHHKVVIKKQGYSSETDTIPASSTSELMGTYTLKKQESQYQKSNISENSGQDSQVEEKARDSGSGYKETKSSQIEVRARSPHGGYEGINVHLGKANGEGFTTVRFHGHTTFDVGPGEYLIRARISSGSDEFVSRRVSVGYGERKVVRMEVDPTGAINSQKQETHSQLERQAPTFFELLRQFIGTYWILFLFPTVVGGGIYYYYRIRNTPRRRQARAGHLIKDMNLSTPESARSENENNELNIDEATIDEILGQGRETNS